MREAIHIARTKDEAPAKLKTMFKLEWIFDQVVLAVPGRLGAFALTQVVGAEQVKEIRFAETGGFVHFGIVVDEERECDPDLVTELAGVSKSAESDRGDVHALLPELPFRIAQLRDMLAAEDSTPVAQKNDGGGTLRPQRAESE
jgi:hypothetical protein